MLLTNKVEDPLNWQALQVTDIPSARYALKIANDQFYAVIHMREQMEKELARSAREVYEQSVFLLRPYIPAFDSQGHPTSFFLYGIIPDPLPEKVPQHVKAAIAFLNAQLAPERERAEAELADNSEELNEMREYLEGLVKPWFIAEVKAAPDWLCGSNSIILGGCTLVYENGDVTFTYEELDYGD